MGFDFSQWFRELPDLQLNDYLAIQPPCAGFF